MFTITKYVDVEVDVEVDEEDFWQNISDEEILDEVKDRKLSLSRYLDYGDLKLIHGLLKDTVEDIEQGRVKDKVLEALQDF